MTAKEIAAHVRARFENRRAWTSRTMQNIEGAMCLVGGVRTEIFGSAFKTNGDTENAELYRQTLACLSTAARRSTTDAYGAPRTQLGTSVLEADLTSFNDCFGYESVMDALERAKKVCP